MWVRGRFPDSAWLARSILRLKHSKWKQNRIRGTGLWAQKGQAPLRPEVDRNLPAPDSYQGDNDGEATAIAPVIHTIDRDGTERWFDLSGRQLSGKPAKKGVYIHRGKKQVVK